MAGIELLEAGPLSVAIKHVAEDLRAKPADVAARTFYFELLCLNGDLERAAKQLEVLGAANSELGVGIYLGAIQAERERRQFFHGGLKPRIVGEAPLAAAYIEAIESYAAGDSAAAAKLLEDATETSELPRGVLNGKEVTGLSETSDLLGPFLEVVMDGHYAWIQWDAIRSFSIPQPKYLRDTVWSPISLQLSGGGHGEALVFSLYVDSQLQEDDLKLGRKTIWLSDPHGFTVPYGQKVITTDQEDCAILDMRSLEVQPCP
jgi:type VI secretion system protein ImpE